MKKLLFILLAINILSYIFAFFMIMASSFLYAVVFAVLGILQLIPIIAIIMCIENIEALKNDVSYLQYKLKHLEDGVSVSKTSDVSTPPVAEYKDIAIAPWECVKCGTVNKAETAYCSNCKAAYSPFVNPTVDPNAKKKISRWVKFK